MSAFIMIVFGICALIGLWGLLSLGVAMYKSGGPIQLLRKWMEAVTGKTEE